MNRSALDKYVDRYALPESVEAANAVAGSFARVVVVPACGETAEFLRPLEQAAEVAGGRTLAVLVVNAREGAEAAVHTANDELLAVARAHCHPALEIAVIDRAAPGRRFSPKEGVGTARRLGLDLATALVRRRQVALPWLFNTDGDARVPADYFAAVDNAAAGTAAIVLPFRHSASGEADIDRAHRLYEMSLRYYCLGLHSAGSRYAHHSMGSAMVFESGAYAAARGMPRRQAAEDFYMLDKLAKLGRVWQPRCTALEICARTSDRVPFGTGRAVTTLVDGFGRGDDMTLYDPRCFEVLARVLRVIDVEGGRPDAIAALDSDPDAGPALAALGAITALADAAKRSRDEESRRRRLGEWFDGFRTMRFVHELRDRRFPNLPWREAIAGAAFVAPGGESAAGSLRDLEVAASELCRLEWERLRS